MTSVLSDIVLFFPELPCKAKDQVHLYLPHMHHRLLNFQQVIIGHYRLIQVTTVITSDNDTNFNTAITDDNVTSVNTAVRR